MNRTRMSVVVAAGAFATLGIAGTALAAGGESPSRSVVTVAAPVASPSGGAAPSDDATPSSRSSASPSGSASQSSSASPDSSASPSSSASPGGSASPGAGSAAPAGGGIDEAAARQIAVRAAGGGQVEDVERETEHGREVWDVEVTVGGVEHDVDVDAATGEVTRHETDDDRADERDGDGADERDDDGDDDQGVDRDDDRGDDRDDD